MKAASGGRDRCAASKFAFGMRRRGRRSGYVAPAEGLEVLKKTCCEQAGVLRGLRQALDDIEDEIRGVDEMS